MLLNTKQLVLYATGLCIADTEKYSSTGEEMKMEHSDVDAERRNALKMIAAGVGVLTGCAVLPERWVAPIIGNIVLPAHADTSGRALTACTVTMISGNQGSNNIAFNVDGAVTPAAAGIPINVAFAMTGGNGASGSFNIVTMANGAYSIGIGPSGGPGYTSVSITVTSSGANGTATCSTTIPAIPTIP